MEQPQPERPAQERKPILEQMEEMNIEQLIALFVENKNFSIQRMGFKLEGENKRGDGIGITPETLRIAIRTLTTNVPNPSAVRALLEKIKSNK